jgi:ABC-type dipeptide/oligopeptide/nickel transport system permease subunit
MRPRRGINMLKKLNYPLIFGTLIIMILILIVTFQQQLITLDPYAENFGKVQYIDGEFIANKPPLAPNKINILGTDILGRDIYSRIIAGASITLKIGLLTVLFRLIIAIPLAFFAGFGNRIISKIIKFFSISFTAVPALIVSFLILNLTQLKRLELEQSIMAFAIVLTFVGWGRLAYNFQDNIKNILNKDFIQGEIAIGKNRLLIAVQNVIPHLLPSIIINSFFEMGKALMMLAALGVFGVYVGVNKVNMETIQYMRLTIIPSYYPEWGGMLSTSRYAITISKPWLAFFPALAFFISIIGFNLLGEGIAYEVNKRDSKVIPWIKRLFFHLSPLTYIYEIRHFNNYKKNIAVKTSLIIIVIIIILIPPPKSIYELNEEEIFKHIEELSKDKYEGRLTGTKGRDAACEYIIAELKKAGVQPLFDGKYISDNIVKRSLVVVNKSVLTVTDSSGNKFDEFRLREDFNLFKVFYTEEQVGELKLINRVEGEILTFEQLNNNEYDKDKKYFVVLDWDYIKDLHRQKYVALIEQIAGEPYVTGIIAPYLNRVAIEGKIFPSTIDYSNYDWSDAIRRYNPFYLVSSIEAAEKIAEHKGKLLSLDIDGYINGNTTIKNVAGIIEGKDKESPLVLVTSYDYYGYEEGGKYKGLYKNGTSISALLEVAKGLKALEEKPEKTIIFAFLDSSLLYGEGASCFITNEYVNGNTFFIYTDYLGLKGSHKLFIDSSFSSSEQGAHYNYIDYIKQRVKELGLSMKTASFNNQTISGSQDAFKFKIDGASGIMLKGVNTKTLMEYKGKEQDDMSLIDKKLLKKQAQLIFDTIVHFNY